MIKRGKKKLVPKSLEYRNSKKALTQRALQNIPLFFDRKQTEIYSQQCIVIKEIQSIPSAVKFASALKYLSGESAPKELVGREKETKTILKFLRDNVQSQITHSFPLIISGIPGIGKTISVKSVVERFRAKTQFPFKIINLNLMRLKSLNDTIPCIFRQLCPSMKPSNISISMTLDSMFYSGKHPTVSLQHSQSILQRKILIIDEVQFLATQTHKQILYCLLNWLHYQHTNMLIILISNQMNFNAFQSRLGTNQLVFKPYTCSDMLKIMQSLLKELDIFEDRAIQYAVKKIAVCSSDIRKMMYLLTVAIKSCMEQNQECQEYQVSLVHIKEAYSEIYTGVVSQMIKILQPYQKLLLLSICKEIKHSQQQYCLSHNVYNRFRSYVSTRQDQLNSMLIEIKSKGMIKLKQKTVNHLSMYRVELRVESDYIIKSLEEQPWIAPFIYQLLA